MRPQPRRRRRTTKQAKDPGEAIARLKRRCAAGATTTGVAYIAVLTASTFRPTALRPPVAIGLLLALGSVAALCALAAVLAWATIRMGTSSDDQYAEELKWAMRFGEELADAFHGAPGAGPGGR